MPNMRRIRPENSQVRVAATVAIRTQPTVIDSEVRDDFIEGSVAGEDRDPI